MNHFQVRSSLLSLYLLPLEKIQQIEKNKMNLHRTTSKEKMREQKSFFFTPYSLLRRHTHTFSSERTYSPYIHIWSDSEMIMSHYRQWFIRFYCLFKIDHKNDSDQQIVVSGKKLFSSENKFYFYWMYRNHFFLFHFYRHSFFCSSVINTIDRH